MASRPTGSDAEQRLLADIGKLADRVRALRQKGAATNDAQIRSLNEDLRAKWEQLRMARAGAAAPQDTRRGGHYR
jgi:hypothetical protein